MKVKELIELIENVRPNCLWAAQDAIANKCKRVAKGINRDKHRWYSVATDVYECEDGFVGVTAPSEKYDECATWADLDEGFSVGEYRQVMTVSYQPL